MIAYFVTVLIGMGTLFGFAFFQIHRDRTRLRRWQNHDDHQSRRAFR